MKTRVASHAVASQTRAAMNAHGRSAVRAFAVAVWGSDRIEYFDNAWLANGMASKWAGQNPGKVFMVFENAGRESWWFTTSYEKDCAALPTQPVEHAARKARHAAQRALPKIIYRKRQEATA